MIKTISLTAFYFLFLFSISYSQKLDKFESTIVEYEQEDKSNGYQKDAILFTGSSSIRRWNTMQDDFSPTTVLNRGFGGSTIPEVTYYADRIILPHKPKIIVFYCGENDLANDEAVSKLALKNFKGFAKYMNKNLPDTKVYFVSIKPSIRRWHYWTKMAEANSLIQNYIDRKDNFYYVDVASAMLDDKGIVLQDIFVKDNLHLNEKGYGIWTGILKPLLDRQNLSTAPSD